MPKIPECPFRLYAPGERKGNKHFLVRGQYKTVPYEKTLETTDPALADLRMEEFWERVYVFHKESGQHRKREIKTLKQAIDQYIDANDISAQTVYRLTRLIAPFGSRALTEIEATDPKVMAKEFYAPRKMKASTMNRSVVAPLAAVLHFMAESGVIPYKRIPLFRQDAPRSRRPADGTMEILLNGSDGRQHDFLLFLFSQGWRVSEAAALRWAHDDRDEGSYLELSRKLLWLFIKKGKFRGWKSVPMSDEVFELFANWEGERVGYVWPWHTRWSVYNWLTRDRKEKSLCSRLGVVFTPHMARHEFGSAYSEQGADSRDLTRIGTWVSEKSTAVYDHTNTEYGREILSRRKVGKDASPTPKSRGRKAK